MSRPSYRRASLHSLLGRVLLGRVLLGRVLLGRVLLGRVLLGLGLLGQVFLVAGCETQVPTTFPSASEHPDEERRPDGVAVDLESEPPGSVFEAHTDDGVVSLQTPLGSEAAMKSLRSFFTALESEDIGGMMRVMDSGALLLDIGVGTNRRLNSITSLFRQRFQKHDFRELSTRLLYREGDVVTYRGGQSELLPVNVRHLSSGEQASPTDLVLRVPIVTHSIDNQRLLGDELFFWMRRRGGGYVIYRLAEDVPL